MVICPVQFYDRWSLARVIVDDYAKQDKLPGPNISQTLVRLFQNHTWLADDYLWNVLDKDVGPLFKAELSNVTNGELESKKCYSKFVEQSQLHAIF